MIRALAAVALLSCSSAPIPPDCPDTIYGALIEPADSCLPALQVWTRDKVLTDGQACSYAAWFSRDQTCPLVLEAFLVCPNESGWESNVYDVLLDLDAGGFLWHGGVRVPSGSIICEQTGGGTLTRVE